MGVYRLAGNKTPGSSANETGANLPPSLLGWLDKADDIDWSNVSQNVKDENQKRKKKKRWRKNPPKDAAENAEFIKKGGGVRPAF